MLRSVQAFGGQNSNTMESQTTNNNVADDFLSYHRSLGNHVLTTYVGGAGWLVDDISVSEKKFPPKTVLMKTSKCTELGSIVLEPLDNPNLNTTFRAKRTFKFTEPPASDVLDQVQTSRADHEVEKYDIVTMVMKVEGGGGVGVHHVGEVGVTYCKVKRSTVKVTCRGLREIAVDFQTLANNLASLSLREKLRNDDDSFLVMTHVLAAKELSWEKVKGEEERVRYGGKLKLLIGACLGDVSCDVCREKETPEKHLHAVRDAILAFKLAKVNVTDKVTIARDGVLKDGEFEGNYTLARGEVDRAGQYALRVTYRQDEPPRLSRDSLVFRLLGAGGTREDITVREEDLLTSGTYQTRFYRDSTGLFPLRGVRVWKKRPKTLMEWIRVKFAGTKDRSRLKLVKVTVTGVQHDVTQVCRCGETEVARGNWAWFGCYGQGNGEGTLVFWSEGFTVSVQYTPEDGPTTTTAVTVQPDSPLAALMAALARETHVPCARQAILHNDGRKLKDPDACLKDLGIVEGTHLVLKKTKRQQITDSTDSPDGASQEETDSGEEAAILDMDRATLVTEVLEEIKVSSRS
ncbi:uncharacterized protein LOC144925387 [Branchiostoma floridae x Branchiostoma belcheri]